MPVLYIVATPIGNLEDITYRAIKVLNEVDIILCEDTRHSKKLLNHYNITNKKLISLHSYNEGKKFDKILELIELNDIALVSDSGTPTISDPGSFLINKIIEKDFKIVPIPGPSALITLLSASGLPFGNFYFAGFLTPKKAKRKNHLSELKELKKTNLIFYESPHRIMSFLKDCADVFPPETRIIVGRELTKKFEEIIFISCYEVNRDEFRILEKGEFTIIINNI